MCIFRHYCPDWDDMDISLLDSEAVGCGCYRGIPAADILYEERSKELDDYNEQNDSF